VLFKAFKFFSSLFLKTSGLHETIKDKSAVFLLDMKLELDGLPEAGV